jgi:hypothetical protein
MPKLLQRLLLLVGVVGLLAVLIELGFSVAATMHGSTPVRVVHVNAGPYPLTVNLYKYPANAGYAMPFSIASEQNVGGTLTYDVFTLPAYGMHATPVRASISPDANVHNGVQGTAEITVQGNWTLQITVTGPAGTSVADVPIVATAPPAIPLWLGWLIGLIPLYGLFAFLLTQGRRKKTKVETDTIEVAPEGVTPSVGA